MKVDELLQEDWESNVKRLLTKEKIPHRFDERGVLYITDQRDAKLIRQMCGKERMMCPRIEVVDKLPEGLVQEKWNDSGASDANGRWAKYAKGQIGVGEMAAWLIRSRVHKKTRAEKIKSAMGAISQQQNTSKLITAKQADALRNAISPKKD